MPHPPTLRQELTTSLVVVFAGAFIVAAVGVVLILPRFDSLGPAVIYLTLLLTIDVTIFAWFGRKFIQNRLLTTLDELVVGAEAVAAGDYSRRMPTGDVAEISRVSDAVNRMAERLISHREHLAANVRSLEETNRLLTEARDELVRAEKEASVGRLAAGIAHEVGNPLGAIMGYLGILQRTAGETERELLAAAEQEARRIDRIVRGLLDYARPRESKAHMVDINGVVDGVLELLSTQGRFLEIEVKKSLGRDLPPVQVDPYQLEQVLVNLLLNATDAMEGTSGPTLEVSTRQVRVEPRRHEPMRRKDDPPDVDYSHRRRFHQTARIPRDTILPAGGETVEISVRDNGPGIPAKLLDQIFEPFVTSKEPGKGTGLGLAVAARLIDTAGGTIRVESVEGQGATFTIVLPAVIGSTTDRIDT